MCGRYYVEEETWDVVRSDFPELSCGVPVFPSGDIMPSMNAPSLVPNNRNGLQTASLTWGFPGFNDGKLIINARAEGIADKPTFADSIRKRRCVLPAAGFYEWDRSKQKVGFTLADMPILYLAGVYRPYGEALRFVIITREANESMLPVHDRMPLIIPSGNVKDWIFDPDAAKELLIQPQPPLKAERRYEQMSLF